VNCYGHKSGPIHFHINAQNVTYSISQAMTPARRRANLRFHSRQSDISLHCETTDTGLVLCAICLLLAAPTREGVARLSLPGWLVIWAYEV